MGHVVHHAIVVTSHDAHLASAARQEAERLGCSVTSLAVSNINADHSFLIGSDGSKSGWEESEAGDVRRDEWIAWATAQRYADGSSSLEWVEVEYGSDDRRAKVTRHEWQRRRAAPHPGESVDG